jgi:hypothetical protein
MFRSWSSLTLFAADGDASQELDAPETMAMRGGERVKHDLSLLVVAWTCGLGYSLRMRNDHAFVGGVICLFDVWIVVLDEAQPVVGHLGPSVRHARI